MDSLLKELEGLEKKGNLSKSIEDVQKTIDLLVGARNTIAAGKMVSFLSMLVVSIRHPYSAKATDMLQIPSPRPLL